MPESLQIFQSLFHKFYPHIEVRLSSQGLVFSSGDSSCGLKSLEDNQFILATKDQGARSFDFSRVNEIVQLSVLS